MKLDFSRSELAILHCLRDGDDPYGMLEAADPDAFARAADRLLQLGMVQRNGRQLALTIEGMDQLDEPGNTGPIPLDDYDV